MLDHVWHKQSLPDVSSLGPTCALRIKHPKSIQFSLFRSGSDELRGGQVKNNKMQRTVGSNLLVPFISWMLSQPMGHGDGTCSAINCSNQLELSCSLSTRTVLRPMQVGNSGREHYIVNWTCCTSTLGSWLARLTQHARLDLVSNLSRWMQQIDTRKGQTSLSKPLRR